MSTQHPDNVTVPIFASAALMTPEDEIREAFYAFAHLECDEQMWDYEGKEVDVFVVEKLLSAYGHFFRDSPLGGRIHLTPRVPNPRVEPLQAKGMLEVLHSLPRHADAARIFYGEDHPPITELIFPMTTSAQELERIYRYYCRHVSGVAEERLIPGDLPLREWIGDFQPKTVSIIPLVEDLPDLLAADRIVEEYVRDKRLACQRVFIARSDPALNYGVVAATLGALVALDRLHRLESRIGLPIMPIIGCGSVPFRGGLAPARVDRVLATYPSVQTFTLQSAFKYDNPVTEVVAAIRRLKSSERAAPLAACDDTRLMNIMERSADRYRAEVGELADLVNSIARYVPRRRMRRLHIGLFGYSRRSGGISLPRAITFCAALYAIGVCPELLGLAVLDQDDWRYLSERVPGLRDDLLDAAAYLDPEAIGSLPPLVAESARAMLARLPTRMQPEHAAISRSMRGALGSRTPEHLTDLVVRGGLIRHFLG